MVVQVVAAQIGEHRGVPAAAGHPFLGQGVGRHLHHRVRYAGRVHVAQQRLQFDRLGGGERGRIGAARVAVVDRSDDADRPSRGFSDGFQDVRGGGLPARSGHADQFQIVTRPTVEDVGERGQQSPRPVGPHYAHPARDGRGPRNDDRARASVHRFRKKRRAVPFRSRQRHEHPAGRDAARIVRQPRDGDTQTPLGLEVRGPAAAGRRDTRQELPEFHDDCAYQPASSVNSTTGSPVGPSVRTACRVT